MSKFRDRIEDERTTMAPRFEAFKGLINDEVETRKWFRSLEPFRRLAGAILFFLVGGGLIALAQDGWRPPTRATRTSFSPLSEARSSSRRSSSGRRSSWADACGSGVPPPRRPRPSAGMRFAGTSRTSRALDEAPPATLALWERFLVRDRLRHRRPRAPGRSDPHAGVALHEASTIYWISPGGDLGLRPTQLDR